MMATAVRPHKERMWDGNLGILAAIKKVRGDRLTTIFLRRGRYALDPRNRRAYPPADLVIERIGDPPMYDFSIRSSRSGAPVGNRR